MIGGLRFGVLTTMTIKPASVWYALPCNLVRR